MRDKISGLRFRFDRLINSAITDITQRDPIQLRGVIQRIQETIVKLPDDEEMRIQKKQGELIVRLFDQLQKIASANVIDDKTRELIDEVFGENAKDFDLDDSIVDIRSLNVSDTFKSILRYTLRQGLDSTPNRIASILVGDLLDIEKLLIEKFLGFYNNKLPDIKNYIYIAWCFWAFLLYKDKGVRATQENIPFYENIPKNWKGITLNYTSFLEYYLGEKNTIYFHGGLSTYVRMDNRELLTFDDFESKSPLELLESHICDNWSFDEDDPANSCCLIPSLVPPLRLKPILSKKYIDLWFQSGQWLKDADHIIIIGYSLNTADEHFNDLLRALSGKKITVIGPNVLSEAYMKRIESVWGISPQQFTHKKSQNKKSAQCREITLIEAYANDINLSELS
ncbi:hypothetical protein [Actinobacillus arthritidis]|uniref:hypothetical protein n=1 Tax=Actinobacillus arthritidis TaxID=157339 RepID=UPI002441FC88|nr:hypothetical protein [Actinobacillus arthritidis]WGE89855.1 hypothetical protein NYR89_02855 [Actinobacillus arthritidis]